MKSLFITLNVLAFILLISTNIFGQIRVVSTPGNTNGDVVVGDGLASSIASLTINGGTNTGKGPCITFQESGNTIGWIGRTSYLEANSSANLGIQANTGKSLSFYANNSHTAAMTINTNNNIAIGVTTANSKLSVNTSGQTNYSANFGMPSFSGTRGGVCVTRDPADLYNSYGFVNSLQNNVGNSAQLVALYGYAYSTDPSTTGIGYGVIGMAGNQTPGQNYGVCALLRGDNNGAAIYAGVAAGATILDAKYAGYFNGNVKITGSIWAASGTISGSDERIKKNISDLDSTDKIFKLKPKKYNLKSSKELGLKNIVNIPSPLPDSIEPKIQTTTDMTEPDYILKKHYGLVAQDVKQVYPDLVYEGADGTLGIDYNGLIPIIIEQMKQMKTALDAKDTKIAALEKRIGTLEKKKQ
jgi:hypothetical protein